MRGGGPLKSLLTFKKGTITSYFKSNELHLYDHHTGLRSQGYDHHTGHRAQGGCVVPGHYITVPGGTVIYSLDYFELNDYLTITIMWLWRKEG